MYSFAQRPDARVVDEPLYAHYLRVTGAEHPDREKVLASMESDGRRVVEDVVFADCDRGVLFLKQMAHHLVDLDREWLLDTANVFLVRDPEEMLPSLAETLPSPTLADTGLPAQVELLDELRGHGLAPPVLDATELLLDPAGVLRTLCHRLGIPFEPKMLEWQAGPRPEDGVWAPHWYGAVHASTGFRPYRPKSTPFPPALERLLAECGPLYDRLRAEAIEARPEAER
jgi:hypothetical protein